MLPSKPPLQKVATQLLDQLSANGSEPFSISSSSTTLSNSSTSASPAFSPLSSSSNSFIVPQPRTLESVRAQLHRRSGSSSSNSSSLIANANMRNSELPRLAATPSSSSPSTVEGMPLRSPLSDQGRISPTRGAGTPLRPASPAAATISLALEDIRTETTLPRRCLSPLATGGTKSPSSSRYFSFDPSAVSAASTVGSKEADGTHVALFSPSTASLKSPKSRRTFSLQIANTAEMPFPVKRNGTLSPVSSQSSLSQAALQPPSSPSTNTSSAPSDSSLYATGALTPKSLLAPLKPRLSVTNPVMSRHQRSHSSVGDYLSNEADLERRLSIISHAGELLVDEGASGRGGSAMIRHLEHRARLSLSTGPSRSCTPSACWSIHELDVSPALSRSNSICSQTSNGRSHTPTAAATAASNLIAHSPLAKSVPRKPVCERSKSDLNQTLVQQVRAQQLQSVTKLLVDGANVEARDSHGDTVLCIAARQGQKPMVRVLLEAGAKINAQGRNDMTATHYAFQFGYHALGYFLVSFGADASLKNVDGKTCYQVSGGNQEALPTMVAEAHALVSGQTQES